MEAPQPPQDASHTRPLDPTSPIAGERRPKRTQRQHMLPPEVVPYGGTARKTTTVANALHQGIEATITKAKRTEEILREFASISDNFAARYTAQLDQNVADDIAQTIGQALVVYYQNKFGTQRATPHIHASNAFKNVSYADQVRKRVATAPITTSTGVPLKEAPTKQLPRDDNRILVTIPTEGQLHRENSYILENDW